MGVKVPAVVLGVDVSALAVARSLGRRGIPVFVVGVNGKDYASASRYARFVMCEDLNDEASVLRSLHSIGKKVNGKSALFSTADLHVLHISRSREELSRHFCFVLPGPDVIETLMDKKKFFHYASSSGFLVPETFYSDSREELERISEEACYPSVVKPLYRTAYWSRHVPPEKKVMKVATATELLDAVQSVGASGESLIVQEWIPGGDDDIYFCLSYLDRSGEPLALFTGRKLRVYPPLTGHTCLAESRRNLKLETVALKLLTQAGCRGLCSVEFKRSTADGLFRIIEPTVGRFDLQEGIGPHSGIDIPYIAYLDAIGEKQEFSNDYREGIIWVNEPFEFNSLLARQMNGAGSAPPFWHYGGKRRFALLAGDDPGPFFQFLKVAGRRGARYLQRRSMNR